MRIYIAAPYQERETANLLRTFLENSGFKVISSWLWTEDALCHNDALKDLQEICDSDAVLVLNPPRYEMAGTGGRHVELGYAIATGRDVIVIGRRSNMFHYLDSVSVVGSWEEARDLLRQRRQGHRRQYDWQPYPSPANHASVADATGDVRP